MSVKVALKKIIPGIVWQNPYVNVLLRILDPVDYVIRYARGLSHQPPYSKRVRSNGFTKQFGGKNFQRIGRILRDHLVRHANLNESSRILEIGCGCGRMAIQISEILESGDYIGMDVEKVSLIACRSNPYLNNPRMKFDYLDVQNDEYNPNGRYIAKEYRFPYPDESRDVVFLISVFTHMLTADVRNYIGEISRVLAPGGICMLTTFLTDHGVDGPTVTFRHREQEHFYENTQMPEIIVGYLLEFYVAEFAKNGARLLDEPLWGHWRYNPEIKSESQFGQDIVFFVKDRQ